MTRGLHSRCSARRFPLATAALALLVATPLVLGQLSRFAKVRDLKYPELYEQQVLGNIRSNQLKGLLTGAEGQYVSNDVVLVKRMQLEHYGLDGRTNLIARAPECYFNPMTRLAWSTGQLEIVAMENRFILSGREGFQASLTNTTLIVSNRVRTVLKQNLLKPVSP